MSESMPGVAHRHVLKLFVAGATPHSVRAIANLRRLLEREIPGAYELDVIDLYQDPEAARDCQVIAAPTLVKLYPKPLRRIIGDLSDVDRVMRGLGIEPRPEAGDDASAR